MNQVNPVTRFKKIPIKSNCETMWITGSSCKIHKSWHTDDDFISHFPIGVKKVRLHIHLTFLSCLVVGDNSNNC